MSVWVVFLLANNIGFWVLIWIGTWRRVADPDRLDTLTATLSRLESEVTRVREQLDRVIVLSRVN